MTRICFQGGPQDGVTGEFALPEQAEPGLRVQCFTGTAEEGTSANWYALTERHVLADAGLAIVATYLGRDLEPAETQSLGLAIVPAKD
jgi:hypothetical protein